MQQLAYSARAEQAIEIPLPGTDLHINALLRGKWGQPLVIVVHGIPGASDNVLPFLGAKYFTQHHFATLRINLYDWLPGTRNLVDCTLQTHADDFDAVVAHARAQGATQIFAAGHSYGGLTILRSTRALQGAVLWDPSDFAQSVQYDKDNRPWTNTQGVAIYNEGAGYLIPEAVIAERETMAQQGRAWMAKEYPTLFVVAGKGPLVPYITKVQAVSASSAKFMTIDEATHGFLDSDKILFELYSSSLKWLQYCQERGGRNG